MNITRPWRRDVSALRKLGADLVAQCDHLERNGRDDTFRAVWIAAKARHALRIAERMERRMIRERNNEGRRDGI